MTSRNGVDRTLLIVDCTVAEQVDLESQATLHEIEDGSQISDHVIRRGRGYRMEGIVSDTPITLAGALIGNTAGFIGGRIGGAAGSLATAGSVIMANLALSNSAKASRAALDIFEDIYANNIPLTIVAGLATYTNMVMEHFSDTRNAHTAGALVFKADFRQIRIVSGQTVDVPREAKVDSVKDLGAAEQRGGRKQPAVLEGAKAGRAQSWAHKLLTGMGVID